MSLPSLIFASVATFGLAQGSALAACSESFDRYALGLSPDTGASVRETYASMVNDNSHYPEEFFLAAQAYFGVATNLELALTSSNTDELLDAYFVKHFLSADGWLTCASANVPSNVDLKDILTAEVISFFQFFDDEYPVQKRAAYRQMMEAKL